MSQKNQKDTADIVLETDLAPPSKRRMLEEHRYSMILSSPVSSCCTYDLPRSLHSLFEVPAPGEGDVDEEEIEESREQWKVGGDESSLQVEEGGLGEASKGRATFLLLGERRAISVTSLVKS